MPDGQISMISGRQIREARALLKWTVEDLQKRAGVGVAIIRRAENVDGTPSITLFQAGLIQQALERAGLRFGRGGGVLMAAKEEP